MLGGDYLVQIGHHIGVFQHQGPANSARRQLSLLDQSLHGPRVNFQDLGGFINGVGVCGGLLSHHNKKPAFAGLPL